MNRIEHHGVRSGQPIRPPAAAIFPPATTRGQGHCQAVEIPPPPPERKPPAVAGPYLLPVEGLVSSDRIGLNRHGARRNGNQGRSHRIPARGWWVLRGGVRWVWRELGGGRLAGAAGAFWVRCWAQFSIHIHQKLPQAARPPHQRGLAGSCAGNPRSHTPNQTAHPLGCRHQGSRSPPSRGRAHGRVFGGYGDETGCDRHGA
jgi:hypothetical protein